MRTVAGSIVRSTIEIRDTCKMAVNSYVAGMSSTRLDDLFVERLLTTLRLHQLTEQQTQRAFPSLARRPALSYELTQMDVEIEGTPITAGEGLKEGDDLDQEIARLEQRRTERDARKEAEKRLQADMGRPAQDCREATCMWDSWTLDKLRRFVRLMTDRITLEELKTVLTFVVKYRKIYVWNTRTHYRSMANS